MRALGPGITALWNMDAARPRRTRRPNAFGRGPALQAMSLAGRGLQRKIQTSCEIDMRITRLFKKGLQLSASRPCNGVGRSFQVLGVELCPEAPGPVRRHGGAPGYARAPIWSFGRPSWAQDLATGHPPTEQPAPTPNGHPTPPLISIAIRPRYSADGVGRLGPLSWVAGVLRMFAKRRDRASR